MTLDDGTPIIAAGAVVAGAPNVSIVTNSFTADGGDNYAGFGQIPPTRKVNLGLTYEQALVEYLLSFPSPTVCRRCLPPMSATPTRPARAASRSFREDCTQGSGTPPPEPILTPAAIGLPRLVA